jgi:hypothetical protein
LAPVIRKPDGRRLRRIFSRDPTWQTARRRRLQEKKETTQVKTAYAAALALLAVALVPAANARKGASKREDPAAGAQLARLLGQITHHRDETWRWQRVMQRPRTAYAGSAASVRSVAYRKWARNLWQHRAVRAKIQALNPPHKAQWLCIHRHEAQWTDSDAPYYGGLQMDREFQVAYGTTLLRSKGTADHWTPLEQMWVAERAYETRGFWPWPSTARYCGLLD